MTTTLPCRRIEISPNLNGRKKNGFMWAEVISSRKKKTKNTVLFSTGFDSYEIAKNAAKAFNKRLIKPLSIYHRGVLVK